MNAEWIKLLEEERTVIPVNNWELGPPEIVEHRMFITDILPICITSGPLRFIGFVNKPVRKHQTIRFNHNTFPICDFFVTEVNGLKIIAFQCSEFQVII